MRPFVDATRLFIVPSITLMGYVTTPQVFGLGDVIWNSNSPSDPLTIQGFAPSVFNGIVTNGMSAGSVNGQWYSLAINDASASRTQMEDARIRFLTPVLVTGDEYLIDNAYLEVFIADE